MESSKKTVALAHQVMRSQRGKLSTSIEAHLEMEQKRGHTREIVVENEDEATATPKHTEGMRPKIKEETFW